MSDWTTTITHEVETKSTEEGMNWEKSLRDKGLREMTNESNSRRLEQGEDEIK